MTDYIKVEIEYKEDGVTMSQSIHEPIQPESNMFNDTLPRLLQNLTSDFPDAYRIAAEYLMDISWFEDAGNHDEKACDLITDMLKAAKNYINYCKKRELK